MREELLEAFCGHWRLSYLLKATEMDQMLASGWDSASAFSYIHRSYLSNISMPSTLFVFPLFKHAQSFSFVLTPLLRLSRWRL